LRQDNSPSVNHSGSKEFEFLDTTGSVLRRISSLLPGFSDERPWTVEGLTAVAELMEREMEILMYDDFNAKLFGLPR